MKIIKRVLDKEFQGKTPPTIPIPLSGSASRAPPVDKSFPIGPELMAIKVRMHYRARFFFRDKVAAKPWNVDWFQRHKATETKIQAKQKKGI